MSIYIILLIFEWIIIVRKNRWSGLYSNVSSPFLKDNILQFEDSICFLVNKFVFFLSKIPSKLTLVNLGLHVHILLYQIDEEGIYSVTFQSKVQLRFSLAVL